MAQLVEHILGKDEVPGPNPGSSSTNKRGTQSGASFVCATTLALERARHRRSGPHTHAASVANEK